MKISYSLCSLSFFLLIFTLPSKSESKILHGENTGAITVQSSIENKSYGQLPVGVTQGWLNDARDQNVNKIISYNESFPGQQNTNETDDIPYDLALMGPGSFGYSVSGAGDVNGDGYGDVIVGAYGAFGTGRAYIFF